MGRSVCAGVGWGCSTYPLKVKTPRLVEIFVVLLVLLAPEELQVGDLEIAPVMAQAPPVAEPVPLRQPGHQAAQRVRHPAGRDGRLPHLGRGHALRLLPVGRLAEQARTRVRLLVQRDGEAVRLPPPRHLGERVVRDVAKELDVRLDPPVPLVVAESLELVEFAVGRR